MSVTVVSSDVLGMASASALTFIVGFQPCLCNSPCCGMCGDQDGSLDSKAAVTA